MREEGEHLTVTEERWDFSSAEVSEWVFEGPDGEVGIFGDLIVHLCAANLADETEAEVADVPRRDRGPHLVRTPVTFKCPACGETTETYEDEPKEWHR